MAFGTSRHRAWVAGLRPLRWLMGSGGRCLGSVLEAVFKPLGGLLGACCGHFGDTWRPVGGSLWQPGAVLGWMTRNVCSGSPSGPPLGA
eukprot:9156965-Pyramimonas_sp.AAC.1